MHNTTHCFLFTEKVTLKKIDHEFHRTEDEIVSSRIMQTYLEKGLLHSKTLLSEKFSVTQTVIILAFCCRAAVPAAKCEFEN